MSSQEEILNNFINEMEYMRNNYRNIYNIDNTIITEQLPQTFINYADHILRSIDIENFTREQLLRQYTIIFHVIILFETLLQDDDYIFTDEQKTTFSDVLRLYNEKRLELERINPNPRTGGKKSRKNKKTKKSKKSRKDKKSKKRV
jgi:hypothetical protein